MTNFWKVPGRVEALRKHAADGLSAAQSAKLLGEGCTRNMVGAKRHRLGLCQTVDDALLRRQIGKSGSARLSKKAAPVLKLAGNGAVFEQSEARVSPVPMKFTEEPGRGLRITDPGFSGCRWPLSGHGADMKFCCAKRPEGAAYCTEHAKKAYTATSSARELARGLRRYAAA